MDNKQPNILSDFDGNEVECQSCAKRFAGIMLNEDDVSYCCEECYEVWLAFPGVVD
jgi:hypothetical protein